MNGISTLTQKGQIVIPESIRSYFHLEPATKIYFEVRNNEIIAKPLLTIDKAFGFIQSKKKISQKQMKQVIKNAIIKKYKT